MSAFIIGPKSRIIILFILDSNYLSFCHRLFGGGDVEEVGDLVTNQGLIVDEGIKDL